MFSYNLGTAEKIVGFTSLISIRSLSSEEQKNISALINKGKNIPATLSYECDKGRKDINLSLLILKSLNIEFFKVCFYQFCLLTKLPMY